METAFTFLLWALTAGVSLAVTIFIIILIVAIFTTSWKDD